MKLFRRAPLIYSVIKPELKIKQSKRKGHDDEHL